MFLATYQISSLEAKLMICQFRGDGTEYVDLVSLDFHARGILSAYIANHFSHSVGIIRVYTFGFVEVLFESQTIM
jgi:hypothetical protein